MLGLGGPDAAKDKHGMQPAQQKFKPFRYMNTNRSMQNKEMANKFLFNIEELT